jgi:predicted HicB family RNase H-like nuclease
MKKETQEDYKRLTTRYPPDLYAELQASAKRNGRSVNAEVVARVQIDRLAAIERELGELRKLVRQVLEQVQR